MRTACVELYRLCLSKHPRAFSVLLSTLSKLPLPSPQERVDLRISFVDEDGSMAPLREISCEVVPVSKGGPAVRG